MKPRVSIITALYNHESYLPQAVDSVLAQTSTDWELIIWDDGSTDGSLALARSYVRRYPQKIFVYTHSGRKNLGQEASRNEALKVAQGEFICLLDSDDYWYPHKLERQLIQMASDPQIGIVYGAADILGIDGTVVDSRPRGWGPKHLWPRGFVFSELVLANFIVACTVMFRRSVLKPGFLFETRYGAIGEFPLWLKVAHECAVGFVDEGPVAVWREHAANTGTRRRLEGRRELVNMVDEFLADPLYSSHRVALRLARAQYVYDLAVLLIDEGILRASTGDEIAVVVDEAQALLEDLVRQGLPGMSCKVHQMAKFCKVLKSKIFYKHKIFTLLLLKLYLAAKLTRSALL